MMFCIRYITRAYCSTATMNQKQFTLAKYIRVKIEYTSKRDERLTREFYGGLNYDRANFRPRKIWLKFRKTANLSRVRKEKSFNLIYYRRYI